MRQLECFGCSSTRITRCAGRSLENSPRLVATPDSQSNKASLDRFGCETVSAGPWLRLRARKDGPVNKADPIGQFLRADIAQAGTALDHSDQLRSLLQVGRVAAVKPCDAAPEIPNVQAKAPLNKPISLAKAQSGYDHCCGGAHEACSCFAGDRASAPAAGKAVGFTGGCRNPWKRQSAPAAMWPTKMTAVR